MSLSMTQILILIMKHPTSSTNLDNTNTRHTRVSCVEIVLTMDLIVKHGPHLSMSRNRVTIKTLVSHNEHLDSTLKNDRFDTESYLIESLLNRDTLMASSPKIDSLLDEFTGELIFLKSIPPGIDEADCDPEEDIHFFERLLYDNSSPRPPKEFNFEKSNAIIESFSPSAIPVEDSDPFMEEIDLFLASDGSDQYPQEDWFNHKEVDNDLCEPGIVHLIALLGVFMLNLIYKFFPQKHALFPLRHLLMTAANDLQG
nr:hypothetical protein [Tanacetum cinerariifolium]